MERVLKEKLKIKGLSLKPDLAAKIDEEAKLHNRSFSNFVETLLMDYLDKKAERVNL